jgi:hypothetical protein
MTTFAVIRNLSVASAGTILFAFNGINEAQAATLTHRYDLKGTPADTFGGSTLQLGGGTLSGIGYTFDANQGLSLSNAINPGSYSIVMDFLINDTSSYRKLIDFKDLSSDNGLYNTFGSLNFYVFGDISGPTAPFSNGVLSRLVVTRDASNLFAGYVNGVLQFQFTDSGSDAIFSSSNNIIRFLTDDTVTGGTEASGGFLSRVEIYDGALTAAEAAALGGPAPIPTPVILPGLIGLGLGLLRKRRAERV